MHKKLLVVTGAILLAACVKIPPAEPPGPAPTRDAMAVSASFGTTWDAVIDYFATNNIPIRTIERASGIIVAEGASVAPDDAVQWADCGKVPEWVATRDGGHYELRPVPAEVATYNFLVRGDSTQSTVLATVSWGIPARLVSSPGQKSYTRAAGRCVTRGTWELEAERAAKTAAEAKGAH